MKAVSPYAKAMFEAAVRALARIEDRGCRDLMELLIANRPIWSQLYSEWEKLAGLTLEEILTDYRSGGEQGVEQRLRQRGINDRVSPIIALELTEGNLFTQ